MSSVPLRSARSRTCIAAKSIGALRGATALITQRTWAAAGLGLAMSISFSRPDASVLPILLIVAARGFLRQADMLVAGVSSLFFNAGDGDTAARLNEITTRLTDEIELVERLIAKDG